MTTQVNITNPPGSHDNPRLEYNEEGLCKSTDIVAPGGKVETVLYGDRSIIITESLIAAAKANVPPYKTLMTFSEVLLGLTIGKKFCRANWTRKDIFIFRVNGSPFTVNREPLISILAEGTEVNYGSHIDVMLPDNQVSVWSPTQEDMVGGD